MIEPLTFPIVRAAVDREPGYDADILYVWVYRSHEHAEYLGSDGDYYSYNPGEMAVLGDPRPGLRLPRGAKQAIIDALIPQANHSVEAELRRQLALAEGRIEKLINWAIS